MFIQQHKAATRRHSRFVCKKLAGISPNTNTQKFLKNTTLMNIQQPAPVSVYSRSGQTHDQSCD